MRAPIRFDSMTSRAARCALCIVTSVLFAAAAVSCGPARTSTRGDVVRPPADATRAAAPGAPIVPYDIEPRIVELPPEVVTTPVAPPGSTLPPVAPEPATDDALPPPAAGNVIALILPLEVPAYERASSAVRDGFLDAAEAAGARGNCIVLAHGVDGVITAFESARARGVRVAVGPLVRDDLKTLALSGAKLPWTVALNQPDDDVHMPAAMFAFPLTVESDGRMLAQRVMAGGVKTVDVIAGDSLLMKRFAGAFASAWSEGGGRVPDAFRFDPAPEALTSLRRTLGQTNPDAVLLAVSGDRAALLKPFIGSVRAYASGLVFERPPQAVARDLDDVRVVEIPWLLTPNAAEFNGMPRREFDSAALARLYALGLDAFRVAAAFKDGPPEQFELDGATGHISLAPGRQFVREGKLAVYRNGELVPLDTAP
jgi:outer membrane PBP1 activator LpoA protein